MDDDNLFKEDAVESPDHVNKVKKLSFGKKKGLKGLEMKRESKRPEKIKESKVKQSKKSKSSRSMDPPSSDFNKSKIEKANNNASSIAKKIVKTFNNPCANTVKSGDFRIIVDYLYRNNRYSEINSVSNNIADSALIAVLEEYASKNFDLLLNDPEREGILKEMLSKDHILQCIIGLQGAAEYSTHTIDIIRNHVGYCNSIIELDSKTIKLESLVDESSSNYGLYLKMLKEAIQSNHNKVIINEIEHISSPKELFDELDISSSLESITLQDTNYTAFREDKFWNRIQDQISAEVSETKDVRQLTAIVDSYSFVNEWYPDFDNWAHNKLIDTITSMADDDLESCTDYYGVMETYKRYESMEINVVDEVKFVRRIIEKVSDIIDGFTDIVQLDSLYVNFNPQLDERINEIIFDKEVALVIDHINKSEFNCHSLNGVMESVSNESVKMDITVLQAYAYRAQSILDYSEDIKPLTDNYSGFVCEYIDKSGTTADLCHSYCNRLFELLGDTDSREIPELELIYSNEENQEVLELVNVNIADILMQKIESMPLNPMFAWIDYFENKCKVSANNTVSDRVNKVVWEMAYRIGLGLLNTDPKVASEYLLKVQDRDTNALNVLAKIGLGVAAIQAGEMRDAYASAEEARNVSEDTSIAGYAFWCYIRSLDNALTTEEMSTLLSNHWMTDSKDGPIVTTAMNYATRAYANFYPVSLNNQLFELADKISERKDSSPNQANSLLVLSHIVRALNDIDCWHYEKVQEELQWIDEQASIDPMFERIIELIKMVHLWGAGVEKSMSRKIKDVCEDYLNKCKTRLDLFNSAKIAGYVNESDEAWSKAIAMYKKAAEYTDCDMELRFMCSRLYYVNGELENSLLMIDGIDVNMAKLIRVQIKISSGTFRVKRDLDAIKPEGVYETSYKFYVEGLSQAAAGVSNNAVDKFSKALEQLDPTTSRQSALLAVNIYRLRAKALMEITKDNLAEANGDMESAFEILDEFSLNMLDIQQLKRRIEAEKSELKESRQAESAGKSYATKSAILSFDGFSVGMHGDPIGIGGRFNIFIAIANDGKKYAVRIHNRVSPYEARTGNVTAEDIKIMNRENEIWEAVTESAGDSVVRLISHKPDNTHYPASLMEYAERVYSKEEARMSMRERGEACLSLLRALDALHKLGVVHNDVKPENLLEVSGKWKLADFDNAFEEGDKVDTKRGTSEYMSPEHFNSGIITTKSDIWAAGVFIFRALNTSMRYPFDGSGEEYENNVKKGNYRSDLIAERYKTIMDAVFSVDPSNRPTAGEFLEKLKEAFERGGN